MIRLILSMCLTAIASLSYAQYAINGKVVDSSNGEPLIGAAVTTDSGTGTVTNYKGEFALNKLSKEEVEVTVSYVGFEDQRTVINSQLKKITIIELQPQPFLADEIIVSATRAGDKTPTTSSNLSKEEIEKQNFGQDLPFMLNWTPSLVTTSDAGAGIGYTGLRIRGSDASRINVTINGVPLNDSESQGVFWVDIPDIASSTQNIQVQRGVGTSTNGAGAFGGTINLQTNTRKNKPYAELINATGSYNTWRHTLGLGTGLIDNKWSVDARVSKITSDGYIDRATSDLSSYYFSGGYYGEKTLIKAIVFGGSERTYQSWYGTPEAVLENDSEGIEAVIANNGLDDEQAENIRTSGRTFNWYLYDNQVDDYKQDHYQLHISQELAKDLIGNVSLHYTYGRGFFEQYRRDDDFSDYALPDVTIGDTTITSTDLVRRRWLDNDFYGFTYSFNYEKERWSAILGGAYNQYRGDHFGEIIWAEYSSTAFIEDRYYDNDGDKDDFNSYLRVNYAIDDRLSLYGDVQYRNVQYDIEGVDNDLRNLDESTAFDFFNPKFGLNYVLNDHNSFYASYAVANREPVRSDFIDSPGRPQHETMRNLEVGYRLLQSDLQFNANFYLMDYDNQLVLTGELNDVGSAIRTNVADSYRVGIDCNSAWSIDRKWKWLANLTLSRNKIRQFEEVIYDYGANFDEFNIITNQYEDTDISFSPNIIAGSQLLYSPVSNFEIGLLSKYVGEQYLDNTSNEARSIDSYMVHDLRFTYLLKTNFIPELGFSLLINNIASEKYASNGYTFGYQGGDDFVVRENYYYPQAERNFLASITLKF
ncbi:TonB-dependent receptor [Fulvivirga sp. RKSG066]|uniref:TonB-dependent receptor n=1 Tax=Fulvivirga aurantia TaxID=2529383 RepID=UPI0012BB53C3|nr:TonB-dependent receptor [Fulvivirga aurantia]MTI21996.1 TonB-dependent receptor [Fulvivirga aurantia]